MNNVSQNLGYQRKNDVSITFTISGNGNEYRLTEVMFNIRIQGLQEVLSSDNLKYKVQFYESHMHLTLFPYSLTTELLLKKVSND